MNDDIRGFCQNNYYLGAGFHVYPGMMQVIIILLLIKALNETYLRKLFIST